MDKVNDFKAKLNSKIKQERLAALKDLMVLYKSGELKRPEKTNYVNNHVHTIYSFSPYSPTSAAYTAWISGLKTVGIMDHDSVAGADEFIQAGEIIGIAVTCGLECRFNMDNTPFKGRRLNNPDQNSIAYLALHGIPHQNIKKVQEWITPYRAKREERNQKMVDNINQILKDTDIFLDYQHDVRTISMAADGGSVTERHILYALSEKIIDKVGKGENVLDFLKSKLDIEVIGKNKELLSNASDDMYEYYLLGVLKGNMVEHFYVNATDECPDVLEFVKLAKSVGAIAGYPYLGDIGESVTGDKKPQTFEDGYLDELVAWVKQIGFDAVTFMPTRNTREQLERLMSLCDKYELFQISGEDINTPFQSFICKALEKPEFRHLIDSTWALIGHESAASINIEDGMFSPKTLKKMPKLKDRIKYFEKIGRETLNQ